MTMPEATVSEKSNSLFGENKIWVSNKIGISTPAGYVIKTKDFYQFNFC